MSDSDTAIDKCLHPEFECQELPDLHGPILRSAAVFFHKLAYGLRPKKIAAANLRREDALGIGIVTRVVHRILPPEQRFGGAVGAESVNRDDVGAEVDDEQMAVGLGAAFTKPSVVVVLATALGFAAVS